MEICKIEQYLYIKIVVFLAEMHGSALQSYVNHWVIMSYHIEQFQGGRQHSEWNVNCLHSYRWTFHAHSQIYVSGYNRIMHGRKHALDHGRISRS
jgi:hypothetical protein